MKFFKNKHKRIAKKCSYSDLVRAYESSEKQLKEIAKTGNEKALKEAMREHGNIEYALLYRETPCFRKKFK